ncbi:MAG: carotenoid biosynthesis protein [Acidobacteria bacterium]|nr:carotenoid biosynthesis protein [Acidobacteriota bacterium]
MTFARRFPGAFVWLTFAVALYVNVALLEPNAPLLPLPLSQSVAVTVGMLLFAVAHSIRLIGGRTTAIFFVIAAVVSWLFEQVGVASGFVYGAYHYGDQLGAKLGHVPILIPLAWFMMIYPSYVIASLIFDGRPFAVGGGTARILWRAILAGMVMTAWDIVIDPGMAASGVWTWEHGGPYFGVPLRNFAGWMLTTVTVYILWGVLARRVERIASTTSLAILPVICYAVLTLRYAYYNEHGVLGVVALFAMGFPALAAFSRAVTPERT